MKVYIDASMMCKDGGAIGRLHGLIDLLYIPPVGSWISFLHPNNHAVFPSIKSFMGMLKVENIIVNANLNDEAIELSLENILVESKQDGLEIAEFFEKGFEIYLDEYEYEYE